MERQGVMPGSVRFGRRCLYDFQSVRARSSAFNARVPRTEARCRCCALKPITRGRISTMRKRPPFVEFFRDRHGKPRLYFRKDRRLPRIRLPGGVGSPEFNRAYEDALAGRLSNPTLARAAVVAQGTIEALVRSYMQNREYRDLRQTTKAGYASRLETIRRKHGHRLVAEMTRERIVKAFLDPYADRPGAALSMLKMLRILIKHAITLG